MAHYAFYFILCLCVLKERRPESTEIQLLHPVHVWVWVWVCVLKGNTKFNMNNKNRLASTILHSHINYADTYLDNITFTVMTGSGTCNSSGLPWDFRGTLNMTFNKHLSHNKSTSCIHSCSLLRSWESLGLSNFFFL